MDRVDLYRKYVKELILQHGQNPPEHTERNEVETEIFMDTERDHYQILRVGWQNYEERVYGTLLHIAIKNGKIWIHRDGIEHGTANELLEMGVPKEDIVLAFYPPYRRVQTEFAVN